MGKSVTGLLIEDLFVLYIFGDRNLIQVFISGSPSAMAIFKLDQLLNEEKDF